MLKKYISLSFLFLLTPVFAMERESNEATHQNQQASHIYIHPYYFAIQDETTVLTIKNLIYTHCKIPVHQQILEPSPNSEYTSSRSQLHDHENIKNIIERYNSSNFRLTIIIDDSDYDTSDEDEDDAQNSNERFP